MWIPPHPKRMAKNNIEIKIPMADKYVAQLRLLYIVTGSVNW
jgi:hypothetical protein